MEPENGASFNLLLMGCGNMGSALLSGWTEKLASEIRVTVVDPVKPKQKVPGVFRWAESIASLPGGYVPEIIVLAVKPQSMDAVLKDIKDRKDWEESLYISIAAGKTISYFQDKLSRGVLMIRAMPNTPALIGKSVTALVASKMVNEVGVEWAEKLMKCVGEIFWLESEEQMDVHTAVAGSGPAYFFYMIECLAQAAREAGLPQLMAEKIALGVANGAAELAVKSGATPEALRRKVTSPGGTTEAAIDVLSQKKGLEWLMSQAVMSAIKRAREL